MNYMPWHVKMLSSLWYHYSSKFIRFITSANSPHPATLSQGLLRKWERKVMHSISFHQPDLWVGQTLDNFSKTHLGMVQFSPLLTNLIEEVKPLGPKSDLHQVFSNNITPESHTKVTRINENDYQLKKPLVVKQILLTSTFRNLWRTVWRICIVKLRCQA